MWLWIDLQNMVILWHCPIPKHPTMWPSCLWSLCSNYTDSLNLGSDRDPVLLSSFWKSLFTLQGTTFNFSSAYHPQSDRQIEALNKSLEGYLRCYSSKKPKAWSQWLPLAEWWYNSTYHSSTKLTPFVALYGHPPPKLLTYVPGTSANEIVNQLLKGRAQILNLLKNNLEPTQNKMKIYADKKRTEWEFEKEDCVYLRL